MRKYIIGSVRKDKKLTICSLDSSSMSFGKKQCYLIYSKNFVWKGIKRKQNTKRTFLKIKKRKKEKNRIE